MPRDALNNDVSSRITAAMTGPSITPSAAAATSLRAGRELMVVVPVFRAESTVAALVGRLRAALGTEDFEIVFVDDNSPDDTLAVIAALEDPRVRVLRRVGRSGQTQTCLVTMLTSQARYVALFDSAAHYDETLLAAMLKRLREDADLVVAA